MKNAIGSRVDLNNRDIEYTSEFLSYIEDLLEHSYVKKLKRVDQHKGTTRFQHCINVSYYSYRIALVIGADPKKSARAGLLHDLFWYDWHCKKTPQLHAYFHPRLALKNARKITSLSFEEEDAIINHMWPLSFGFPKTRVSYAVTFADKYSAALEVGYNWGSFFGRKLSGILWNH